MRIAANTYPWYALQVRSRYENIAAALLRGKGYELFLPTYKVRRRWSDRIKELDEPLFPGYLFCRFNLHERLPILVTPGVVQVVGTGKTPLPVDEGEIHFIQRVIASDLARQPWPFLEVGKKVRIDFGTLAGLEGILLEFKGQHRLVLSVTILQRSVAVELDGAWVTPMPKHSPVSLTSSPA